MTRSTAESEWVNSNLFVEGTKLEAAKPAPRASIRDSSFELAQGCDVEEVEITTSMMGLFE